MIKDSFYIKPAVNGWLIEVYDKDRKHKGTVLSGSLSEVADALISIEGGSDIIDTDFREN